MRSCWRRRGRTIRRSTSTGSSRVVAGRCGTHEVPGAFSKGGWAFMKDAIAHADRYFSGEQWVLGDQAAATIDRAKLEQDVKARYYGDFLKEWRTYIKGASVVRYAGLKDASQKLTQLSGNQSPAAGAVLAGLAEHGRGRSGRGGGVSAGADRRAAREHRPLYRAAQSELHERAGDAANIDRIDRRVASAE